MCATNNIELPQWLDNYIFGELGAKYEPSFETMTNIDDDKEKTLNYLGTYFPRSYAESYIIFKNFLQQNPQWLKDKKRISIFDFGCGTGGEIIGLVCALDEERNNLEEIKITAFDGNHNALRLYEKIITKFSRHCSINRIENKIAPIFIDDFYDLSIVDEIFKDKIDIFITFKAICEFVTKQQFESQNAYKQIANTFLPKIDKDGILLLEDVTFYSDVTLDWLPKMMDKGLKNVDCQVIDRNVGYNQTFYVSHSHKRSDKTKVAWRMIKHN